MIDNAASPATVSASFASVLRQADAFHGLTAPQLEIIATLCSELQPKAGELIFEENGAGTELHIIASGQVEIEISPASGSQSPGQPAVPLVIATLQRGQTFGEIALVDQGPRTASARCASRDCRLLMVSRDRLLRLCDSYPDLGYRLMRNIAADLALKIRGTDFTIRQELLWRRR